mmetsp:Transcript_1567/g.2088  ORF Transcript_1567/g.2088 Transcript_1567/m.2088 type:complete len:355 (+) Transcript_1567:128-1192(+)
MKGFRSAFSGALLRKSKSKSPAFEFNLEPPTYRSQTLVEIYRCEMLTNNQSCILCFDAFIHIREGEDKLRVIQLVENGVQSPKVATSIATVKCKQVNFEPKNRHSRSNSAKSTSKQNNSGPNSNDSPNSSSTSYVEGEKVIDSGSKENQNMNTKINVEKQRSNSKGLGSTLLPQTPGINAGKQRSNSKVVSSDQVSSPQTPDTNVENRRSNSKVSGSTSLPQTPNKCKRLEIVRDRLSLSNDVTTVSVIDIADIRWCYLVYKEKTDQPGLNMRSTILGITTTSPNRMFRFVVSNLEQRALLVESICHRRELHTSKNPIQLMHVDSTVMDNMFGSEIFDYDSDEVTLYSSDEEIT